VLSARTESALEHTTDRLASYLKENPGVEFADVAWTLQAGRRAFPCRRAVVAADSQDAIAALQSRDKKRTQTRTTKPLEHPEVAFLFPGQGSQHPDMAREIYDTEPVFRNAVDRCARILRPYLDQDLLSLLFPSEGASDETRRRVTETVIAQPAIFVIEYALAQLWMSWGIQPKAMLGHSIGEFVAACLAGVFSLEEGLEIVATRGRLMQDLPRGGMLSVRQSEKDIAGLLPSDLSLAAVNSPGLCVVAGPLPALASFEESLTSKGIVHRRLVTSHAFHSAMMDPIVEPFTAVVSKVQLKAPSIPYVSCVTGTWIRPEEASDPGYWARHFRQAVQFSAGVSELRKQAGRILLEVGPGNVLATLARQQEMAAAGAGEAVILSSLTDGHSGKGDAIQLKSALGALWMAGLKPAWKAVHEGESRRRISLPTYPFERKRYWIELNHGWQQSEDPSFSTASPALTTPAVAPRELEAYAAGVQPAVSSLREIPPMSKPLPENLSHTSKHTPVRKARLAAAIREILEDLSGMDLSSTDGATTFLEMGFDSLFLTQAAQAIQSKFNVKVTFRQLLGDESSLDALSGFLDAKLPPDPEPAEPPPAAPPVVAVPPTVEATPVQQPMVMAPASQGGLEQLMRQQMEAMNQLFARQLETLRVSGPAATAPALVPPTSISQAVPVPAPSGLVPAREAAAPGAGAPNTPKEEFKPFGPYKPPQKTQTDDFTPVQRHALQRLIEQYTARTAKSKAMAQDFRKVLADPRVVSGFRPLWKEIVYPIHTNRSKGSRLWDVDGNEYIDLLNGFGPILLGHRPDFVEEALQAQLHQGFEIGPQTPLAGEVAKLFCEITGNQRMTFCNTGSEAVIAAMRVARTVTGRSKVVMFAGDYHGMFDEVLVKGHRNRQGVQQSTPVAPGIPRESVANIVVLEYGASESLDWIRAHAQELAAVMVEPVQSRHPNLQPIEFLKEVRKITSESGAALIFDEVVTGFRIHPGGCQAVFGIQADMATYGKVLGGGMPIGVLAGKAEFLDALDGGQWQFGDESRPEVGVTFFAGTFVRHPLTLAAVKAVLEYLKREGPALQEGLNRRAAALVARLNGIFERHAVPSRVENFGSVFYFSFPAEQRYASLLYYHLRLRGVHILEGFPCFLTTAHSDADLDKVVQAFEESVQEMCAAAFFPGREMEAAGANRPEVAVSSPQAAPLAATQPKVTTEAPLTEPQLEVWLSDQLGSEASCSYNESFTVHMRGTVDVAILTRVLRELIDRHDALRARIHPDTHIQTFEAAIPFDAPLLDLSALQPADREAQYRDILRQEASTQFHLSEGPLVRARIVRMDPAYHCLVFTSHHIVCDGWSTNVLLDELARLYNSLRTGTPHGLPPAMSFGDYSRAQKAFLDSSEGERIEKYWLEQFKRPAPLLDLPADRPRPAVKEFKGATIRRSIDAGTTNAIRKAGASQKCTLFTTLLSGFQILLSRLSGQEDIVVGVPTAGQSLLDDAILVGHCVNFIPLRGFVDGASPAAAFLNQMRQTVLDGYDHQNYTYGRLVRKLALPRDPSRLPLTEVQFNLERVGEGLRFDGFEAEVDPNPKAFVNFDIFLNIVESRDGLVIDCDFNTGLFDEATMNRWLGHYETLLRSMAADINRPVAQLNLLSPAEQKELVDDYNRTEAMYPNNSCVHELFEAQVAKAPEATAVVFEDRHLSFAELNRRSSLLASYLQSLGVRPGVLVGVFVDRSIDMMVALLGVMKSGGAYVPMDPTYPTERIAFVLSDASVPVLLTQEKLAPNAPAGSSHLICLDRDWPMIEGHTPSGSAASRRPTATDLAYVIYTSGSTGKPKGVEIQHRAFVNLLCSMAKKPGLSSNDTLLAVTTLSFDIAGLELFLPLCTGARLVIATRDTVADGTALLALLKQCKASVIQATPVTFRLLIEAGWSNDPSLKVLCGGEALPRDLANQILDRTPQLWNMYGPTETTIWSATMLVERSDAPVLLGPPIDNTRFHVCNSAGQLAPLGVPGELYIGGDGLARGYFQRPELTVDRFIPDPFSLRTGDRLYKTGDLVRRRPDGTFEFLGRLDNQVKLRGFRIELGEIETALIRYPGVREAVVMLREDVPGDKRLVGYLATDEKAITVTSLRDFLTGKLPNYMLPGAIVLLETFPLTPNGKVDRRALPAPEIDARIRTRDIVPPSTDKEKKLVQIWSEVLRMDQIGIRDNLFELGADSLHIFQIAARANKAGIRVAPAQFLRYRTISALLEHLEGSENEAPAESVPAIKRVSRDKYRVTR
jgi:amino acid adenylation domain-containing protein